MLTLKEFASKGGKARAKKLSKKRRKEIATLASHSRFVKLDKRADTASNL